MKLCVSKSKNSISYYVAESFRGLNGISTTRIIEKLGTEEALKQKLGPDTDIKAWAKQYIKQLTDQKNANKPSPIDITLIPNQPYEKHQRRSFNIGYLVIQKILYALGFKELIYKISQNYGFDFDLEKILADLIFCRFLDPCSKKSSYEFATENFLHPPEYQLHDVYRSLDYISREDNLIQSFLYKKSKAICTRNSQVLFYDCTNFFFEIDDEDIFRKKGKSKENRTSPLVGLGMFIDGNGIPLGFGTYSGNQHDSTTLAPIETRIIKDFELAGARLIICTDSGINSPNNILLNSRMNRDFITIKPIKKMAQKDQNWVLDKGRSLNLDPLKPEENPLKVRADFERNGWYDSETNQLISLDDLDENDPINYEKIFYKERVCKDDSTKLEYREIATFSIKYKRYMEHKRDTEILKAKNIINQRKKKQIEIDSSSSATKFIKITHTTEDGEQAKKTSYKIDEKKIEEQAKYDGFYVVSTSLDPEEMSVKKIIKINKGRWQIEESFRILKTDFRSRPIYVRRESRIKAHFIVCFIALLIFRLIHNQINQKVKDKKFTNTQILKALRNMRITKFENAFSGGFISTELTDILQSLLGDVRFDCEYITPEKIRRAEKNSKKFKF